MATNTTTILQATSPNSVPVAPGFFVEFAGTQDGGRVFDIAVGAGAESLDPGVTVNLSQASTDFTIERDGSTLRIIDSNGNVAAEIGASTTVTSTVNFTDGSTQIEVSGSDIIFGGIAFADGTVVDPNVTPLTFDGDPGGFDETRDLDALGGTQPAPATTDVSTSAVELTDDITAQNFVEVTGFGADDGLLFTGGAAADDIRIDPGVDETLLTINNGGLISQINLIGVSTGLSVQTVADFNALDGIGDIVIA